MEWEVTSGDELAEVEHMQVVAYGSQHVYLVFSDPDGVRLTRWRRGSAPFTEAQAARNVIVFPLGRGPGRPGGGPEYAALVGAARLYAAQYEAGGDIDGYPYWRHEQPSARRHFHLADGKVARECRELHELPAGDLLADLRAEDGHVPDYNRAEADRRLSSLRSPANDCPNC